MGYEIRTYGDPVLKSQSLAIENIDDKLVRLTDAMLDIMYDAPGIGLAAPQIGVQKQLFVYDIGDGAEVLINPVVVESSGEWVYEEGCLSIPGLYVEMVRPKEILLKGINIDAEIASNMLYTTNKDVPGIIGALGLTLGTNGVNIANFTLGRAASGGEAIALLSVDSRVPAPVVKQLKETGLFQQIKPLSFEATQS